MDNVAVIGAGPSGIVAARYLKSEGFEPVLFDQCNRVGGQWTGDPKSSGVWPEMRTNTSRVMTAFSDIAHSLDLPVFPTNQVIGAYLRRYAEEFDLLRTARLSTRVVGVDRSANGAGWTVTWRDTDGSERYETFARVVASSGRYQKPSIPDIPGLSSFSGEGGVSHSFGYKNPQRYRGQRVLVAGCSISSLEIAGDLAMLGARRVVTAYRRQRYIVQKILAGIPIDHAVFTRFGALSMESFPPEQSARTLKEFILRTSGLPQQFGAPAPVDDVFMAGVAQSQHYLPMVAEGRIFPRPWITRIHGQRVEFADGRSEDFDAIVLGTGYELGLDYLAPEIRRTLDADATSMLLHQYTLHPKLPGLAFVGLVHSMGPVLPMVELQARWLAYMWSGVRPRPSDADVQAGLEVARQRRGGPPLMMHMAALMFARNAGVEPDVQAWPELARALLFGPLSGASFRLSGHDALENAPQQVAELACAFGTVPAPHLTPEQCDRLRALGAACGNAAWTKLADAADAHRAASAN